MLKIEELKQFMSEDLIKDQLEQLNTKELVNLIMNLIQRGGQTRLNALEWLEANSENKKPSNSNKSKNSQKIHDEMLFEYWYNAQCVISQFNCYGGGPEEEEEDAYEWLEMISDLISENEITPEVKYKFMDDVFIEYDAGNSGFDDKLLELVYDICSEKEDWEYLIKKLNKDPSNWKKGHVINIYKNYLKDDKKYIDERLKNLHYGLDYWDLVDYYLDKDNIKSALQIAKKGIENGEGSLTELYDYLFGHYLMIEDDAALEMIALTAVKRKNDEKYVLDKLFEYYKNHDYKKAKEKLLLAYKTDRSKKYFECYKKMKAFLSDSDWEEIESDIIADAQNANIYEYMNICLENGMNDVVIKILNSPPKNECRFINFSEYDLFAEKLEKDYPKEIIDYYYKKVYDRIPNGNRKSYREAIEYLWKVKKIYNSYLNDKDGWTQELLKLQMEFKNRPAFIDEVRKSEL